MCQNHYLQYFSICYLPDSAHLTIQPRCRLASDIEQIRLLLCDADLLTEQMLSGCLWISGCSILKHIYTISCVLLNYFFSVHTRSWHHGGRGGIGRQSLSKLAFVFKIPGAFSKHDQLRFSSCYTAN